MRMLHDPEGGNHGLSLEVAARAIIRPGRMVVGIVTGQAEDDTWTASAASARPGCGAALPAPCAFRRNVLVSIGTNHDKEDRPRSSVHRVVERVGGFRPSDEPKWCMPPPQSSAP